MSSNVYIKRIIEDLYSLLLAVSTGEAKFETEDDKYIKLRRRLNALVPFLGPLPRFIETSENLWLYWNNNVKDILPTYASRRTFLAQEYKNYYDELLSRIRTNSGASSSNCCY